ncbi:hypothetical protein TEA_010677 [Camellia sinensis var. sinensis]|uniref:Uncharacterized protein n=1 Tax=Camellia sinensis var. sinensis TaxID=542762 RepID=A0A4S4E499_CAMSN|nr:hypothetical protein TEA_010677 [Camellia sinensis var. sinensis]
MSAESASGIPRSQVQYHFVDLLDFVDWSGIECLNQSTTHSIANALKQADKLLGRVEQLSFVNNTGECPSQEQLVGKVQRVKDDDKRVTEMGNELHVTVLRRIGEKSRSAKDSIGLEHIATKHATRVSESGHAMDTARRVTERGKTRTNLVGDDPEPFDFDRRSRAPFYFDDPAPSIQPLRLRRALSLSRLCLRRAHSLSRLLSLPRF